MNSHRDRGTGRSVHGPALQLGGPSAFSRADLLALLVVGSLLGLLQLAASSRDVMSR